MNKEDFYALGQQGFNRAPLMLQVLSDLDTPLSIYLKLVGYEQGEANGAKDINAFSFLLESVVGGEQFGRYSFIGLPAKTYLKSSGFGKAVRTHVVVDGKVIETSDENPLDFIAQYQRRFNVAVPKNFPRFCGGLAGYFGYDSVRYVEKKLEQSCPSVDDKGLPDIFLLLCEEVAVIDNLLDNLSLIVYADPSQPGSYEKAMDRLVVLKDSLKKVAKPPIDLPSPHQDVIRDFSKKDYEHAVMLAKRLIEQGDFMQIQIAQCLKKPFEKSPLSLYRILRTVNPSPYMYYYHFGDFHVVGASPEILVRQENITTTKGVECKVTIRPLAGTRPRGKTKETDITLEKELLADAKERAEHVMLIDLARNDIGRIAQVGTVEVTEAFVVERYSHVMHIVSNVQGMLKPGLSNMDVFKATFPAGTLTGAPKIHAMELIDKLEPVKRGFYGGACGYLSFSGDMDIAIAIRTAVVKNNMLFVQAAAGVVADSVPETEWKETEAKARALLQAAEIVENGLD